MMMDMRKSVKSAVVVAAAETLALRECVRGGGPLWQSQSPWTMTMTRTTTTSTKAEDRV
jgi:hypothetical protein